MNATGSIPTPVRFFGLIGHPVRWQLLAALAGSDFRVQELARHVGKPMNLVSYHLTRLRRIRLVSERRSDADSREVYYSLDLDRLHSLYATSGEALHPVLATERPRATDVVQAHDKPLRVLFLCTENSARSQMAEGILRHLSQGAVEVCSAGTAPTSVHPLAIRVLADMNIDISAHRSKGIDEFLGQSFDYIVTVCDRAKEVCPLFPGDPVRIHWSIEDPATVEGDEARRYLAFKDSALRLITMTRYLLTAAERQRGQRRRPRIAGGETP